MLRLLNLEIQKSCGCLFKPDLTGKIFGYLNVIREIQKTPNKKGVRFWECQCICGKIKIYKTTSLTYKKIDNCGCVTKERMRRLFQKPEQEINVNRYFGVYKRAAKKRNLEFNVSRDDFERLINMSCAYCGLPSESAHFIRGHFFCNGLDRINSNLGYTIDNIATCCYNCNIGKREMTKLEFLNWIERVYKFNFKS